MEKPVPWEEPYPAVKWTTIGAQFQHPYVYKSLFSKEKLEISDYYEAKSVNKGAMYLDMENQEGELDLSKMRHIGKTGQFVPVADRGGTLYRVHDGKFYAVSGTKGFKWVEATVAKEMEHLETDLIYFDKLVDNAKKQIDKFGSFEEFVTL